MSWSQEGRVRSWWVDGSGRLVVHWKPIMVEIEDEEETNNDPLDVLTDRQRFVIELRYGFQDGIPYTQREVAELMGVSRSTVHQHERAAIKKLEKYRANNTRTSPKGRDT